MIQSVSINFRPDDKDCISLLKELIHFLLSKGIRVLLPQYDIIQDEKFFKYAVNNEEFVNSADLIIVIGGDGTFLRTVRLFCGTDKPILGINRGRLGFLTEFSPDEYGKFLKKIVKGEFSTVERLVLEARLYKGKKEISSIDFLNDAVIHMGFLSRQIKIELEINNNFLNSYSGDGLIISTPTGSTAYSLSAGGPIITPSITNVFVLSPICPHSLGVRPMIIPATSILKARIISQFNNLLLTIDGQEAIEIEGGDEIVITQSNKNIQLITHPEKNYYEILKEKLSWG